MRIPKILFIISGLCFFFFQGCASMVTMVPKPSLDQEVVYIKGTEHIVSEKKNIVSLALCNGVRSSNLRPYFFVTFENRTDESINFSPENISAKSNGEDLIVFTYEELAAEPRSVYAETQ